MNQLDTLEAKSVHILREAYRSLGNVCMLWSIGKDSTVLLHLARKAFFGHVPIPLVHIDTAYKMPEMIEYRDRLALEWRLNLVVGQNRKALDEKATFPDGNCDRIQCCRNLKTMALKHTLSGEWTRQRMDHTLGPPRGRRGPHAVHGSHRRRARGRRGLALQGALLLPP